MRLRDAIEMLAGIELDALGPMTWADLGCGSGTFTVALAAGLAAGSVIHAMDRDRSALRGLPSFHKGVRITTHGGDFANLPWPFTGLDGILMANSLHYVADQLAFIRSCDGQWKSARHFLVVEYDTNEAGPWVPYPVNRSRATMLFGRAGYRSVRVLRSRPSVYRRAPLYSLAAQ
jgi:ubiquinone/menaquinone biosynthesis C-methylase UbiE